MEKDERLLPLPNIGNLQPTNQEQEYAVNYPSNYENLEENSRSIQEYWHIIYKRLPIILAITILVTAATSFYMYRKPSIYSASTSMIIEPRKPKVNNTIINLGVNDALYYNTQLRLLRNRELMYDVVVKTGLYRNPELFRNQNKGFLTTVRSMFSGKKDDEKQKVLPQVSESDEEITLTPEEKKRAEMYSGIIGGGVKVSQVPQTNIVTISVTNQNPILASTVANGVATVFMTQDIDRETRKAKDIYEGLSKSINDLKTTLTQQEQQLINVMKNSGIALVGTTDGQPSVTATRLSTISSQWLAAMDERRKAEAKYNTARKSGFVDGTVDAIRERRRESKQKLNETLLGIDKEINELESELKELRVKYTDEWFKIKEVKAKIAELKAFRKKTEDNYKKNIETDSKKDENTTYNEALKSLKAQLDSARNHEVKLLNEYTKEVSAANYEGQATRQLTTLKNEIETNRGLLNNLFEKQKQQELIIASSEPDNIKISSKAVTPVGPIGPDRNRNIIIAFLASLIGGIGLAFLLDYLDDSIRTSDDISRNLSLPTLALIPHQDAIKKQLGEGGDENLHSLALIALQNTRSPIAEAYRHLRTSLLFSSAGKPPETVLITSSGPSEGKTTTAINTAITLAQSGAEVVIIDCDLRRPRLHSHFNMSNSHGITNYLSGDKNTENLLKECPGLENLKIITSGPIPPNPAELLSSDEMRNLLQFLKGSHKHIILDSPPAISFTDSAILSTLVDGVVLVAKAGSSSIHLMKRFKQRLAGLGTRIYGVVLNGVKKNSLEYGYYGYDYSYDYYTNSDETTPLLEDVEGNLLEENKADDASESETKG